MDFKLKDYTHPWKLISNYRLMKKAPYWSKDKMDAWVLERLRHLCWYANEHIPFYRLWFKNHDFNPQELTSFSYFEKLPIIDKEIVRQYGAQMVSDEVDKLGAVTCRTSGSTGTPLEFLLDASVNTATMVLFHRAWSYAPNWAVGKAQATISGYSKKLWHYSPLSKILYISSFKMNENNIEELYKILIAKKIRFIRGYPSSLVRFGQLLRSKDLELSYEIMFSGAETLNESQRQYIESTFSGKVIDHYTHWERTASILECPKGHLHAQNDYGYHEILDSNGRATKGPGRLVCTGLHNYAMPLIRYDTRDLAMWSEIKSCPCGSQFPIVQAIYGRIEDVVVTPEGQHIGRLDAAFKYSKDIVMSTIYQPDVHHLIVSIVPDQGFDLEREKSKLLDELRSRVGETIEISFKIVREEDIPKTPAGKVRFVISEVEKNSGVLF